MRLKWMSTIVVIVALTGCARFPVGGSAAGFTRLEFSFWLRGPVNPAYLYVVPLRVLTPAVGTDPNLSDPSQGPIPVVGSTSKNGVVGGLPTHYVIYNPSDLNGLYSVYRFPTRAEEGTSANPNDPTAMDLRWPGEYIGDVLPGSGLNPMNADGSYQSELDFAIDTRYLSQYVNGVNVGSSDAQSIQVIQFNILTMNKSALSGTNERVIDAIGDQISTGSLTFNNPIRVNILTGNTYTDKASTVPEQTMDTYGGDDPSVDLTGWQLVVTKP